MVNGDKVSGCNFETQFSWLQRGLAPVKQSKILMMAKAPPVEQPLERSNGTGGDGWRSWSRQVKWRLMWGVLFNSSSNNGHGRPKQRQALYSWTHGGTDRSDDTRVIAAAFNQTSNGWPKRSKAKTDGVKTAFVTASTTSDLASSPISKDDLRKAPKWNG